MSQRYVEDPAIVSLNNPTGAEGIESIAKYLKDATGEVRNLLTNECDMIYECRYCRALFRSIVHFVSHKRSHCRGTHEALSSNAKVAKNAFEDELDRIERENRSKDHSKRNTSLRQRNLVSVLNKRSADVTVPIPGTTELLNLHTLPRICKQVPITTFSDGVQKIVDCPASLAHKEGVDADQVVTVIPQDHSSKYGDMQLRNRKEATTKQVLSKMTTKKERDALARCQNVVPFSFDVGPNRCRDKACEEVKSFDNILAMAYHIAMKHVVIKSDAKSCLLCDDAFTNIVAYREHLADKHGDVRKAHDIFRSRSENDKKKRKSQREVSRGRSMSPPCLDTDVPVLKAELNHDDADSMNADTDEEPPKLECEELSNVTEKNKQDDIIEKLRRRPVMVESVDRIKRTTRSNSVTNPTTTTSRINGFASTRGSPTNEAAQPGSSQRKEVRSAENDEAKLKKDIKRIARYLIQKTDAGLLHASLSEMVSSGEVSLHTSGRNTPSMSTSTVEKNNIDDSAPANIPTKSEPAPDMDSDDASLAHHKEKLIDQETDKQNEGSSPGTDNDGDGDNDGRLTIRQRSSRTRKRPEWMTTDYVMSDEKETPPVPAKKNRTNESSPSSRNSPSLENVSPQKEVPLLKALTSKKPIMPVRAQTTVGTYLRPSAEPKSDIVSPAGHSRSNASSADDSSCRTNYTPRAKKIKAEAAGIALASPEIPPSPGSSRRKQDMSQVADKQYRDLATVPVYLSHNQKELFFSGLKQMNGEKAPLAEAQNGSNGPFVCEHCNESVPNLKEGRRHMVSHIRVMRLRCKLCKAGAFFCSDMRAHLMEKSCPKIDLAPAGIVQPGTPCMSKLQADELTEVADTSSPGRVMYTSGEIVSCTSTIPYFPDPIIEEIILGRGRSLAGRNTNSTA